MRDAPAPVTGAVHLALDALDTETEFLLDRCIPAALQFIQAALDGGGTVLVHCQHGHSRSVAVAAAFLMRTRNIPASAAHSIIAAARRTDINPAFQIQLLILQHAAPHAAPVLLDPAHSRWRLAWLQSRVLASRHGSCSPIADLQQFAAPALPQHPCDAAAKQCLRCSHCSHALALQANVVRAPAPHPARRLRPPPRIPPTAPAAAGGVRRRLEPASRPVFLRPRRRVGLVHRGGTSLRQRP
jgi:hypothetical protein